MEGWYVVNILGREGYSVCVLEKNKQIGGCLSKPLYDKVIRFGCSIYWRTHKGQNLYPGVCYLGLTEKLKLQQMKEAAFDRPLSQ